MIGKGEEAENKISDSTLLRKRKRKEDSSTFEDSLVGEPHLLEKKKALLDVVEEIEQTFLTEKPQVKRNEDSATFEESLVGEPQAKSPAEKGKAESTTSDSMGHEATDLEMVDTCHKAKPYIPVYLGVPEPINLDVVPRGPVVFVGNLSPQVKYLDVENFFKDCGEILNIRFILNIYHSFDGEGYVEFKEREAAEKAFKLHNRLLNGFPVKLKLGNPWGPQFEFEVEYSRDLKPESNFRLMFWGCPKKR